MSNTFESFYLSLFILAFISILIINLVIYLKESILYFCYLFFLIIWFSFWSYISQTNISNINENIAKIETYDNMFYNDLELEILDIYKIKEYEYEYEVKLLKINSKDFREFEINWIVSVAKNFDLKVWDLIKSKAKIGLIKDFNEFEYKNFLLSKWIYFKSYLPYIENIWYIDQNIILEKIDFIREKSLDIIYKIYPENEAIFLGGILLWARESLSQDIKDNFNNSWLTHFIAVSWFNITILVIFFSYLLKFFPLVFRTVAISLIIISFTFLVWDTAPVIRASIMWLLAYFILVSWRKWDSFTLISLTSFLMVLFSPFILNYDVSFALSFLAVIGIIYTWDFWKKVFKFMPETLAIREAFILTMSAMVFTLPIMLFSFGQFSLVAPITNVLVAWTIPIAMLLWFISILLYLLNPILWFISWYLAWLFLKWDMIIVKYFWELDYSVLKYDFKEYSDYIWLVYFIFMIFLILYFKPKKEKLFDI